MKHWIISGQKGLLELTAVANTKSEARAKFKAFHGGKLPPGTKLVELPHLKPLPVKIANQKRPPILPAVAESR
jgi:hypothetical protein